VGPTAGLADVTLLPGIETRFIVCRAHSLVTVVAELSRLRYGLRLRLHRFSLSFLNVVYFMGKTVEVLRWCGRSVIRGNKVEIYQGHLDRKVDSYRYGNILQGEVLTASMFQKKSDLQTNFEQK